MRLSFVVGSAVAGVVLVAATFACSDGGEAAPGPYVPEGGTILDDGAVVGPDGDLVEQPDATPPKPSKVRATDETVDVYGNMRKYVLAVPKSYDAGRRYPLIVAMHGDGQDGPGFRAFLNFDDLAGDDAIVAYPTGAVDLYTPYDQNNDQLFIDATIKAVKEKLSIDEGKVWGFGYSKGGFMANQLACRKPGLFKAVAIHAGGAPQDNTGEGTPPSCPNAVGLPVLATEGDHDTAIGGEYGAQYWARFNGCGTQRSAATPAECQKYNGCPGDKPVVYCLAPGVFHFPIWAEAAAVSWAFFTSL
jgi:polyhydroxybutyrate depolymerase